MYRQTNSRKPRWMLKRKKNKNRRHGGRIRKSPALLPQQEEANRYEPWNHLRYWKSNDECSRCGCSRQAENCLCGPCRRGGCIDESSPSQQQEEESRYEPWNHMRYWKSSDECSICGCSRQAEYCLCGPCRRGGCIYDSSPLQQQEEETRYEPWNHMRYWKSSDECSICGCSRQAEYCLCGPCRRGGCIYESSPSQQQEEENRYELWNNMRYWKSSDEYSVCGCSRQAENCLCGPCRHSGCIHRGGSFQRSQFVNL
jgi:hypothetical protein